jgi:hypothetical protein
LDYIPISKRSKQENFKSRFSEKLVSSQGNKKEDIDKKKKKKKKKDVQVFGILKATQTLVDIENLA